MAYFRPLPTLYIFQNPLAECISQPTLAWHMSSVMVAFIMGRDISSQAHNKHVLFTGKVASQVEASKDKGCR